MSEASEPRSSLPASFRAKATSPAEEDFLLFDHPVRELPDLLAALDRPAVAAPIAPPEAAAETADLARPRRLRVRRRALLGLAATGVLFLVLQRSGFLPGVFSVHMPLLAIVAVLVVGGTAERVPKGTPLLRNPLNVAFLAVIAFWLVGGSLLQLSGLETDRVLWRILYTGLGGLTLVLLLWFLWRPRQAGATAPLPAGTAADPVSPRSAVLAACREALEQIGRNAPPSVRATGWLDLTGPEKPGKLVREEGKERLYRDVWWRLRLPWENGVRLRLAAIEEVQVRPGSWQRESTFLLLANLAVDPRRWRTEPGRLRESTGTLTVEDFEVTPSRVSVRALSPQWAFPPADLIRLLKTLEARIRPQGVPGETPRPEETPAGGEA